MVLKTKSNGSKGGGNPFDYLQLKTSYTPTGLEPVGTFYRYDGKLIQMTAEGPEPIALLSDLPDMTGLATEETLLALLESQANKATENTLGNLLEATAYNADRIDAVVGIIEELNWENSTLDQSSPTYYYFLAFVPGYTRWKIKRMHKTTYVVDFFVSIDVEGADMETDWTNRTTLTYNPTY